MFYTCVPLYWIHKHKDDKLVKGANGHVGSALSLSCPVGMKINIKESKYVCNQIDQSKQPLCNSTSDATDAFKDCQGKEDCTINVPLVSLCSGKCDKSGVIATYECLV